MASRLSAPGLVAHNGLERIRAFIDPEALRAVPGELGARLWPADRAVLANIIRLLWLPWWLLSDLPGPAPYARVRNAPPATPVAKRYLTILGRARRIQILYRFLTALIRGLILTAAVGCVWSLVALAGGSTVTSNRMTVFGIVLIAISLAYAWWYRPGMRETAAMIDRSFRLDDRLTTAVDHVGDAAGSSVSLPALQQIEAINTLAILSKRPALRIQAPIRELVGLVGLSLLLLALYLLNGAGAGLPALGSGSVPAFVAA